MVVCLVANCVMAQYKLVQDSSSIEFKVKYLGIDTRGTFGVVIGEVLLENGSSLVGSKVDVLVDANSIRTGVELRDNHLRHTEFFDTEKYPKIHFVSTKVTVTDKKNIYEISGQLTIKGHTKEISFPFTVKPVQNGYRFNGSFHLNRNDFEVGKSLVISDNVDVALNVLAVKTK